MCSARRWRRPSAPGGSVRDSWTAVKCRDNPTQRPRMSRWSRHSGRKCRVRPTYGLRAVVSEHDGVALPECRAPHCPCAHPGQRRPGLSSARPPQGARRGPDVQAFGVTGERLQHGADARLLDVVEQHHWLQQPGADRARRPVNQELPPDQRDDVDVAVLRGGSGPRQRSATSTRSSRPPSPGPPAPTPVVCPAGCRRAADPAAR